MFKKLQQKWGVGIKQFWIVFIAFGFTGITTAYLTKTITEWVGIGENTWVGWKIILKLSMLVFGYQIILLIYGALFGQWKFFWSYEKKLLQKIGVIKPNNKKKQIAIFASGTGTNAKKIIEYFKNHSAIEVVLIVSNKPEAGVLQIAKMNGVSTLVVEKETFFRDNGYVPELKNRNIDFIVLAGFLWKIPAKLIAAYPSSIINIHPALLPKYGGKGMYGHFVHDAVIEAKEKESGITIHFVDEQYDQGEHIFQATCPVLQGDTPSTLAQKVQDLEHNNYARVIETCLRNMKN